MTQNERLVLQTLRKNQFDSCCKRTSEKIGNCWSIQWQPGQGVANML